MEAQVLEFRKKISKMSLEELVELAVAMKEESLEDKNRLIAFETTSSQMSKDYKKLESALTEEREKRKELEKKLAALTEQNTMKTNEMFGRRSEKMENLDSSGSDDNFAFHDLPDETTKTRIVPFVNDRKCRHSSGKKGGKRKGKQGEDFSRLPQTSEWDIDPEKLDELYGKDGWKILFWERTRQLEEQQSFLYVKNTYRPILSTGKNRCITRPEGAVSLYPGSFVSPSLLAGIIYRKFYLGLPVYRIEHDLHMKGYAISRQTMINWINGPADLYLGPPWQHMYEYYLTVPYHQCDESFVTVNKDDRKPGTKSFMWVHVTSEHYTGNPVVLFCYEKTRGADHLRKFYHKGYRGYLTCDAYIAYQSIAHDADYNITICGCFMHVRRRWVEAYLVAGLDQFSDEQVKDRPEYRALILIQIIYIEENKLRDIPPEDRHTKRQGKVKTAVEEYMNFIKTIDLDNPENHYTDKLKDAVRYSLNQEQYLTNFLKDGSIPLDDGKTERAIRPFATARHSWMFFDTIHGAETGAIMYSIVETAKANGANVYLYLRYLFEEMPKYMDGKDRTFLEDMMPWSAAYRRYETIAKEHRLDVPGFRNTPPPKRIKASSGPPVNSERVEESVITLVS